MNYTFSFKYGPNKYSFSFNNQLNLVLGDSSTGKTTVCNHFRKNIYNDLQASGEDLI